MSSKVGGTIIRLPYPTPPSPDWNLERIIAERSCSSYGAGFAQMDPATWRSIWNEYNTFLQNPGTQNTSVLVECYSLYKATSFGNASSSYPFRSSIKYNAVVNTWYADPALDSKAEAFGSAVRDLWRSTANLLIS